MDKMIENNQLLMRNGLKLVSYQYIRNVLSVSNLETVKCELNNDRSFFVVHGNSIATFTIEQNEAISKNYMKFLNYLLPTSDSAIAASLNKNNVSSVNSVYIFEKSDMGIVGLTWQYKGETLNTTCLVSKREGLVFDKILSCIPFEIKNHIEVESSTSPQSRLKSTTQTPPPDGPISATHNYNNQEVTMTGTVLWMYNITVILHGQLINGVKVATSPELSYNTTGLGLENPAHYLYGTWDCKADVQILEFEQGPKGNLLYAYAWTYICNGVVNLSWNGTGFVFVGGGVTGGGIRSISVYELC
ncbi:MAG: hypothetical protein JJE17_03770 [Peptostreptococcaceae bacterium]|nr:hypothetical protein [Peptostreptococcaceae bacterium]